MGCYHKCNYNYWGSADGPSGYVNGHGDSVDKNIIFEPWLVEPVPDAGPEGVKAVNTLVCIKKTVKPRK